MQNHKKLRINQSEFNEWKESAASKYFFDYLQEKANAFRQSAGMGAFKKESLIDTGLAYINAINTAEVCELICSLEFEDTIEEEISENNANRASAVNSA